MSSPSVSDPSGSLSGSNGGQSRPPVTLTLGGHTLEVDEVTWTFDADAGEQRGSVTFKPLALDEHLASELGLRLTRAVVDERPFAGESWVNDQLAEEIIPGIIYAGPGAIPMPPPVSSSLEVESAATV